MGCDGGKDVVVAPGQPGGRGCIHRVREDRTMREKVRIAFLFPGQGSQQVGMGKALCERFPSARATFEEANDVLGFDIRRLCFNGPEEDLKLTKNSQPAIFVTSVACARALREAGPPIVSPWAAAGLSLGEFGAHVVAGSFSFVDGLRVVRKRGEFMQEACEIEPGTMASIIGLEEEVVKEICSKFKDRGVLNIGNLNSPGQIAISGSVAAVKAAMTEAEERGAQRVVQLQVSGAFHSRLMKPAEEKLRQVVAETRIVEPNLPVIANFSARPVTRPDEIREAIIAQLCSPVLWEKSMRHLIAEGTGLFVELGQGRVLRGLMRRIDGKQKVMNIQDPGSLDRAIEELKAILSS
jgi:[acyl-carrier-protein] S-malonyltransferase